MANCPNDQSGNPQKRFGDNCYEELSGEKEIEENADRCSMMGMTLWYPESREEVAFVEKGMEFLSFNQMSYYQLAFHQNQIGNYQGRNYGHGLMESLIIHDQ